jgi:hypothetical protein
MIPKSGHPIWDVSADLIVPPFSGGRCPSGGEVVDEAQVSCVGSLGEGRRYPLSVGESSSRAVA